MTDETLCCRAAFPGGLLLQRGIGSHICITAGEHPALRIVDACAFRPIRDRVRTQHNGTVSLITNRGLTVASIQVDPAPLRLHALMSWTSASLTRLYYLNGGSDVRFISTHGNPGTASRIPLGANEQAGFAVSPDDKRIAVAVFTYTPPPAGSSGSPIYAGMRLYVEDPQSGGHHLDIFSSPTVAEFPIGWTGGRLVLAVSSPFCCQSQRMNPYSATEYHVADPATGNRLADLCANSLGPEGPVVAAGALCWESGGPPEFRHWDGSPFSEPGAVPVPQNLNAMSPDGTRVALGGDPIRILGPSGRDDSLSGETGDPLGWLDADHVAFQRTADPELWVLDLNRRRGTVISGTAATSGGTYLGVFPAALT